MQQNRIRMLLFLGFSITFIIYIRLFQYYNNPVIRIPATQTSTFKHSIYDRNSNILALTATFYSAYIDPSGIDNPDDVLNLIKEKIPTINIAQLKQKWDKKRKFLWINRFLLNPQEIEQLNIPNIHIITDIKRIYPYNNFASHIIGFTDLEQNGLAGIEYKFNQQLIEKPLMLTLDVQLQTILSEILQSGMEEYSAKSANGIIANADTGEILAIVSLPNFNPNDLKTVTSQNAFNRNTSGVYEFGSILKVTNLALALQSKKFTLKSPINLPAYIPYGKYKITDVIVNTPMTVSVLETFTRSSNKGNAIMAMEIGAQEQKDLFKLLGYFDPININLPMGKPMYPKKWSKGTIITSSFGYGISMTPLHIIQGFARLITGKKIELSLIKKYSRPVFEQILDPKLVEHIQHALKECVTTGVAKKANIPALFVGGKTGTANIRQNGIYIKGNNMVTFLGAFPLLSNNPIHQQSDKFIIIITLQSPQSSAKTAGFATAGWIAAPIAQKIIDAIAPLLGVYK